MCRYLVVMSDPASQRFGVVDSYGKVYVAQTAASPPAAGAELHGPPPQVGFQFLVAADSGYRYSSNILQVNITQQALIALIDGLQVLPPSTPPEG